MTVRNTKSIKNLTHGSEKFRPYARLISILGDQLITSKWVGVIELVKNCYDADASEVAVRFSNFDELEKRPIIEIEDNGDGMTLDTILNVWMKPATPYKLNQKKSKQFRFTRKGRVMQGDKGVGRFAIYKLGNFVEIFTKTTKTPEVELTLNFREYAQDDEFADKGKSPEKFLDQIENQWKVNSPPEHITGERDKGTLIRISDPRNRWKLEDLERLQTAFQRMIPPTIPAFKGNLVRDFDVKLYWDGKELPKSRTSFEDVIQLAPFSFHGTVDSKGILTYTYRHNMNKSLSGRIDLFDVTDSSAHDLWGFPMFRNQFLEFVDEKQERSLRVRKADGSVYRKNKYWRVRRRPEVGPFEFFFYAFDWKNQLELTELEKSFVRNNSVYLYRDFTRVYPYGEKGIDWLFLSKLRAEDRAGRYFSYNDLLGFVFISQQQNPHLRDAASREGLMNIDGASDDFVALIQTSLKVMKDFVDIDKHKDEIRKEKAFTSANKKFSESFVRFQRQLTKSNEEETLKSGKAFFRATNELVNQYKNKLSITEELAGLGLAVEKSSHDIFMLIVNMIRNANDIISRFEKGKLSAANLKQFFLDLTENLDLLYQELQILQPLFREARKETKDISVRQMLERIERYYRREFQFDIRFKIEGSDDIVVRTNLGLLLQVFINLIDNAIYWLKQKSGRREIIVRIDAAKNQVIVADNAKGINSDLSEIIFTEFYSTKAESGRGLGLYIARELLGRINAQVSLITTEASKVLPGANFLIQFSEAE
ncbi:MAG TPA: sensor histidine kinase [Pyrinomonadaceae bacterium]|nr:sensor histidine kinase [Pyrinomonadaceae bacterium]